MDISLRKKALRNLAKTGGQKAIEAIEKEMVRLQSILSSSCYYEELSESIELLDLIGYRCFEQAISATVETLTRLENIKLKHKDEEEYSGFDFSKYRNESELIIKIIEVLENIRYHNPEKIQDILFEYSIHENSKISEAAEKALKKFAEYNLDIFYGDGKEWQGLGWQPQEKIIEKIARFNDDEQSKFSYAIILTCKEVLSPTVTGVSSDYKTVTWKTGAIPASEGMANVRRNAFNILKTLFYTSTDTDLKKNVINAMHTITETPHMGEYGDDLLELVKEGTINFAYFLKDVVDAESDMQLLQKIEHDAYWLNYHRGEIDTVIKDTSFQIRDSLYSNEEFMIFRALIGFESIFHDWEEDEIPRKSYEEEQEYRDGEAKRLADSINETNYEYWKQKILSYSEIKSNDLATFPYFGKFLEYFGNSNPNLAIKLVEEEVDNLQGFGVAVLIGIDNTEKKSIAYELLMNWCNQGKYIFHIAKFLEFSSELNEKMFTSVFEKAIDMNDVPTLNQIIVSLAARYTDDRKHLLEKIFLPAIDALTSYNNSNWIYNFWFRKERGDLLNSINQAGHKAILQNLIHLKSIDYHVKSILLPIAEISPELVINFFVDRLAYEKEKNDSTKYEAIPYDLGELSEPLSKTPELVIETIKDIYDQDQYLFTYRGAKLIKNIFPNIENNLKELLIAISNTKHKNDVLFVLSILRNYDGNPTIYPVCKEVTKVLGDDESLRNEMLIILSSTGVVSGEYGLVEAYKKKIVDIQPWTNDEQPEVAAFATEYINYLNNRIEFETKRADEEIALMKNEYGSNT